MPAGVSLRSDFTASALRRRATTSRHTNQSRRLFSLAAEAYLFGAICPARGVGVPFAGHGP